MNSLTATCANSHSRKTSMARPAETIVLRYQRGLFLPERGMTSLDKLARERKWMKFSSTALVRSSNKGAML